MHADMVGHEIEDQSEVVLPKRNGPDLEDVPERVREVMTFHLADTYADVLAAAFAPVAHSAV